jgi:hypothetical protein
VWVSLNGHATKVLCAADTDVDELREAIKAKMANKLASVDAADLTLLGADGTPLDEEAKIGDVGLAGSSRATAIVVRL